jgi:predicted nucleotide-binding protein
MARIKGSKTREFPVHTLQQALVIVQGIADKGAGQRMKRLLVADAIGRKPNSSEFKRLLSSSLRYELTTGTEKADFIVPTELGLKIVKPTDQEERAQGLVEACLRPELMNRILRHFNNSKLPDAAFLRNTLEKTFEVDSSHSGELAQLFAANAKFAGILRDISGSAHVMIDDPSPEPTCSEGGDGEENGTGISLPELQEGQESTVASAAPAAKQTPQKPKNIFVAHGKNHKSLGDLKKILDQFKIPCRVGLEEAHAGRPISKKVAQLMDECSAGIFIFTRDEKFMNEAGEEIWRPSENVVYELGAASKLWDNRIILLKEEGVSFPSDFSDLGYITFAEGEISSKALEILNELVALGLVKIQAA